MNSKEGEQMGKQELKAILGRLACYFATGPDTVLFQYLFGCANHLERKITQIDCSQRMAAFSASLLGYFSDRKAPLVYGRNTTFLRAFSDVLESETLVNRADGNTELALLLSQLMQFEEGGDWDILEGILEQNFDLLSSIILEPVIAKAA